MGEFRLYEFNIPIEFKKIAHRLKERFESEDWFIDGSVNYYSRNRSLLIAIQRPASEGYGLNIIHKITLEDLTKPNVVNEVVEDVKKRFHSQ